MIERNQYDGDRDSDVFVIRRSPQKGPDGEAIKRNPESKIEPQGTFDIYARAREIYDRARRPHSRATSIF